MKKTIALFMVPLVLLAVVIALFVFTGGAGLNIKPEVPLESVVFKRTVLKPGVIELQLQNTGREAITITAININDGITPFTIEPSPLINRLGSAVIKIPYIWVMGDSYAITVFTANSTPLETTIDFAVETPKPDFNTFISFMLIGLFVGVIPIFLGLLWFPALRQLGHSTFIFLMAVTIGLLLFLGVDAASEALEQAGKIGEPYQGNGLVAIGIIGTILLLYTISQKQRQINRSEQQQRLATSLMISIGIGLHNLGEGLAIGASYSVGAATLGMFFVIGFIIQNITEGLGILAPIVKDKPGWKNLLMFGLIAGLPAIVGVWIGGFSYSMPFSVLCLSVGAGAVFEVAWEIGKMVKKDMSEKPVMVFMGVMTGMLALYLTGFIIK